MSKTIDTLKNLLNDELESSENYAKLALDYKIDNKLELAQEMNRKSEEELKHAMTWHDWILKEIEKKKDEMVKKGETIPPIMIARWEVAHEEYIKQYNDIKRNIAIFKGI